MNGNPELSPVHKSPHSNFPGLSLLNAILDYHLKSMFGNTCNTCAVPSHPSRTQFYSISDPIADLILIRNQTYIRPEILKNQTSRRIKDLLRLFLKYFPFTFNFEHSFWRIAIENHLLSSLTASILSQKQNIKSKWNRLFGLCVVLKVQKRTKADFFKQKRTHFRG